MQKTKERAAKERAVKERAVITVNGIDHSGIIAAITRALADLDVNIEDLSQTIVQGLFTMILIADITDHDLAQLQKKMAGRGQAAGRPDHRAAREHFQVHAQGVSDVSIPSRRSSRPSA